MGSSLWAVTMVKDEADIIAYTLRHLAAEGVDGIIVADNLSSDGTRDILEGLDLQCELIIVDDHEVGYYQSKKMTALAKDAFQRGAGWVVPFDADELWCSPNGASLREFFGDLPTRRCGGVKADLYNHYPIATSSQDPNPFKRLTHHDTRPAPLPKVAIRAGQNFQIHQGNHGVTGRTNLSPGLQVRHFPWRSYEQFEGKVRNGYKAYQATNLSEEEGNHWRGYGRVLEEHGEQGLRDLYEYWFQSPPNVTLIEDPAPYRV